VRRSRISPLLFCGDAVYTLGKQAGTSRFARQPRRLRAAAARMVPESPLTSMFRSSIGMPRRSAHTRAGPGAAPPCVQGKRAEVRSDIHHHAAGRETPVVLAHQDDDSVITS